MKTTDEMRAQYLEALAKMSNYPDIEALIASGDLRKVRGGYNALTEAGFEAIKDHIASIMTPNDRSKPALFTLHRRRKS